MLRRRMVLHACPVPRLSAPPVAPMVSRRAYSFPVARITTADQRFVGTCSSTTIARRGGIILIGAAEDGFTAPYGEEDVGATGMKPRALINRVIVLNCYGRGGSGIVWRMISSNERSRGPS